MLDIIKKFRRLMDKRQKKKVGILLVVTTIGAFLEVMSVSLMVPLLSAVMDPSIIEKNQIIRKICRIFDLNSHRTFIIFCIVILVIVFILKDVFLMLLYYAQARFVYNNRYATQLKLFKTMMSKKYEYFIGAKSSELLRIVQTDVVNVYNLLMVLIGLISESIVSIALVITIFITDPMMTLFVAAILLIMLVLIIKVLRKILYRSGKESMENIALTNKWLLQGISGIKEVKVAKKEEFFYESFSISGYRAVNAEKWYTVLSNVPRLLIEMVSICSMLILIAVMIYRGREIELLIPTFGAFGMAAVRLMPSANRIISAINSISYYKPGVDKLLQNIESIEKETDEEEDCEKELSFSGSIELKDVSYKYPNSENYVLKNANMEIPLGSSVGIVGSSGAGKTTVVDILLGLLDIEEGRVLLDGKNIMESHENWVSNIGYIPQNIFMLDASIKENVAFGIKEEDISEEQVMKAIREARLDEFVLSLKDGINTEVGERGIRFSGGQRQRLSIARALYTNPKILILDEATSALDTETEREIMESINSLSGKKTLIIIAHRLETIKNCDIVYRVSDGSIVREK